jgi:hypothetical protein
MVLYTTANFVEDTQTKRMFINRLPDGVSPQDAASRFAELAIPLSLEKKTRELFFQQKVGWMGLPLVVESTEGEHLFTVEHACNGAYNLTFERAALEYLR